MLFNSYGFVFAFLPLAFVLFWYGGRSITWRLSLLTASSYLFYSWWQFESWDDFVGSFRIESAKDFLNFLWHWRFTLIMLASSSVDYWSAKWLVRVPVERTRTRRLLLLMSLAVNLGLLGFFKYFGFFTQIASDLHKLLSGGPLPIVSMVLPVGISFYTFESISYVIDIYRGLARPAKSYLDYACFISFFPHLVAGPIIRYSDILHQFRDANWTRPRPDWNHVNIGLLLLTMGMAKKLLIADSIAVRINPLWDLLGNGENLGFVESWAAVLGYTFRIYFDFSGYSDMAIGLGHLFAVRLPQNFNSPYKATDPSDFWRRWHMSLSAWLRDYLYIPLGGNRNGMQNRNLMITMVLGGLWHGAAWLFVVWGAWHGLLLVVFHFLKRRNLVPSNDRPLGYWFNRLTMFLLVVIGWVFFRAADVRLRGYTYSTILPALRLLGQMVGRGGFGFAYDFHHVGMRFGLMMVLCWIWCNFAPNSAEVAYRIKPRYQHAVLAGVVMAFCILCMGTSTDFLYFRF